MSETRITLANLEQHLAALQDIENEIAPEQDLEFQIALQEALMQVAEKRDRVAFVILEMMRQASVAQEIADSYKPIIARYESRSMRFEKAAGRLRDYVIGVMRTLPKPAKGPRRLEGLTSTLKANGVAPSVDVLDESQIPLEYKRVTVKMTAQDWEILADLIDDNVIDALAQELLKPERRKYEVDRTALLEALKQPCKNCGGSSRVASISPMIPASLPCPKCNGTGKQQIPGALLECDRLRLVIE